MPSTKNAAIVGIGASKFDPNTSGYSYKELMFEAAKRAYADAGIDVREDVGSFICCAEDFWDGNSITDEYMPDQIGAKLRPLFTLSGDGLLGLAHAYMHILAGVSDIVVVESHSKLSDVVSKKLIEELGFDPNYRLQGVEPDYFPGLEMRRYLEESGNTEEDCAAVASKNRTNGLSNPRASYGSNLTKEDILESEIVASPLRKLEVSDPCDGSVVIVLASGKKAQKLSDRPIWLTGISWFSDTPNIEEMDMGKASYAIETARKAYAMAKITKPSTQLDFAEIDDTYAYKELAHIEALALTKQKAGKFVSSGKAERDGTFPVNASGGSLGMGYFVEATGLVRAYESVLQLRGEAGAVQLNNPRKCVVQSWRGVPTQSGVTAVFSR
ncbi:MAG: thiolase C-terminal domain-containing protein [Nitrososphaerales archaeon]